MRFFCIGALCLLAACGPPFEIERPPPGKTLPAQAESENQWAKIIVLDVGGGDAALVIAPGAEAALIDTGPAGAGDAAVRAVLAEQPVLSAPYVFISHHHADHDGGLAALLTDPMIAAAQVIEPANAIVGQTVRLGALRIKILGANGRIGDEIFQTEDENAFSLALLVEYGAFRYLTAGDLTGGGGNPPYQTVDLETALAPLAGDVDILHVNHHGSHTSTNQNFLDGVRPEAAVISVGDNNDHFHPHLSVINRLLDAGIQVYQTERGWLTDQEAGQVNNVGGHICILTNGETYSIKPYAENQCGA